MAPARADNGDTAATAARDSRWDGAYLAVLLAALWLFASELVSLSRGATSVLVEKPVNLATGCLRWCLRPVRSFLMTFLRAVRGDAVPAQEEQLQRRHAAALGQGPRARVADVAAAQVQRAQRDQGPAVDAEHAERVAVAERGRDGRDARLADVRAAREGHGHARRVAPLHPPRGRVDGAAA